MDELTLPVRAAGEIDRYLSATSMSSRQWSLGPHSSTPLSARTVTLS